MAVPTQAHLFTTDIDSLYTNVNTTPNGLQIIFHRFPEPGRPADELLQLLEVFNDKHFLQVRGTATGQRFALSYANIYTSEWEREALAKCPHKPSFYLRFLDDIIGAWAHDISLFKGFIDILNNHHPSIKIKYTIDLHQVNFLDTTVFF